MAIKALNSVGGFSVGETPVTIVYANGDITTLNLSANANVLFNGPNVTLGQIANLHILGGTNGQVISTDGSGNLSFTTISTASLSNGTSNIRVLENGNIVFSTAGAANVGTFTGTGLNVAGYVNLSGNITSGNANLGNLASANYLSGVLTTAAQPNITSVGTLSNLTVTGNTLSGNVYANSGTIGASLLTGTLTTAAQPNITSVGTLSSLSVTGNLSSGNADLGNLATANYFSGNGSLLTGIAGANVTGNVANANYANFAGTAFDVSGSNVTGQVGNALIAGTVYTNAQPNITSVGTLSSLSVTGNTLSGNVYANSGTIGANLLTGNLITGTLTTNAQPNITSVGTLSNLAVTGNISSGNADLGNLATANYFSGNGGQLSGITGGNVTGQVGNALVAGTVYTNAQPNITSVGTLSNLTVTGNTLSGNVYANSGTIGANLITGNLITGTLTTNAQPNITSVGTLSNLAVTGNLSSGNADLGNLATANYFTGTLTTNAQPNITSVGTLSNLSVTGNTSTGNLSATGGISATGNINGGNLISNGAVIGFIDVGNIDVSGNISVESLFANANVIANGNVSGANINGNLHGNLYLTGANTQVLFNDNGILASNSGFTFDKTTGKLTVFANIDAGNVSTTGSVYSNANVTANSYVVTNNVEARTGNINIYSTGANTSVNLVPTGIGTVNVGNFNISNVGGPTNLRDAATKEYVDNLVSTSIAYHEPVYVATTTTLATATGGTTAYNSPNGAANGIGAYISTTGTYLNIDGANVQTVGTRILVKDEANAAWNGVYTYANTTAIVRSTDTDEYGVGSSVLMGINDYFFTLAGTVNEGTAFIVNSPSGTITFGTSNITFAVFSTSQVYDAGTGLSLNGTVFSIANTAVTSGTYGDGDNVAQFTVNSQGQLTAAANIAITANAANLTGTTLNGNIITSSLTTVGTLGNLSVTGNTLSGNVYANAGTVGANLVTANLLTGTLTTNAQPNVTSLGTLSNLSVTGNVSAAAFVGNVYGDVFGNISGNITVGGANTQVLFNDDNLANATSGLTFNKTSNLLTVAGNANASNFNTSGVVSATGNITGGNLSTGGNLFVTGNANVGGILTDNYYYANGAPLDFQQPAGSNTQLQFNDNNNFGATANLTFNTTTNTLTVTGVANVSSKVNVGNTSVTWGTQTTISTSANQTIATYQVTSTDITGVEFFVKGVDSSGAKYSVAKVIAVTNGTTVDYSIFGTVNLNGSTGSLSVNVVSGGGNSNVALQVTPASSNSTVWTTQYRLI